jgi:hypothetical protein
LRRRKSRLRGRLLSCRLRHGPVSSRFHFGANGLQPIVLRLRDWLVASRFHFGAEFFLCHLLNASIAAFLFTPYIRMAS